MNADADGNFSGKHLVVFGCGYVGSEFARQALVAGLRVTAVTRNEAKARALQVMGVKTVVADLAGNSWHEQIDSNVDFALDCVSSGGAGIEGMRSSYIDGMRSLLAWATAHGAVGTLVYTGSTSVYPEGGGNMVDETARVGGNSERAAVLVETESLLAADTGACRRWFVLRLAGIYGPGRHRLMEQVVGGEVAGHAEHRLNLIHRDDICTAVWAAFRAPTTVANDIFNVADDAAATRAEIATWLAGRLGVPAPRFTGRPAGGRAVVTPDRIIANHKIKAVLGWRPRFPTYREGYENFLSRNRE